jgi:type VI secretion system secreted protein Hcp
MSSNIHMKISGPPIAGESTDAGHAGEVELTSFQHSVSRQVGPRTTAGSPSVGNSSHSEVVVTKLIDKATPELAKSICGGQQHAEVKVVFEKTNAAGVLIPYLVYTLTGVIITQASLSGADGGGMPMESVGLNYATIKWEYTPTDPNTGDAQGVLPFGWDVSQNKVV